MQKRKRNCCGTLETWELGLKNIAKQCEWFEKRAWWIEGGMGSIRNGSKYSENNFIVLGVN